MDQAIAIRLELNIIFVSPMLFDHLGPDRSPIAMSAQNTHPPKKGEEANFFFFAIFYKFHFCKRPAAEN